MKSCLTLSLLFFSYSVNAQAPDIEWQNTIGGSGSDDLYCIDLTLDGGYILAGSSGSNIFADKTEANVGFFDFWVIKLDSLGSIVWQNTIGGDSEDYLYKVHQTLDQGYILGGYSMSGISGEKTDENIGSNDYWIIKLDSLGEIQWQKSFGGTSDDKLFDIKQTNDGGYIAAGASDSEISGNKSEGSKGSYDYWVLKLDSVGNIDWQNTIGGNNADNLYTVLPTESGYILAGTSSSDISEDKTVPAILRPDGLPSIDFWIIKIDTSGNILDQYVIGGNMNDIPHDIELMEANVLAIGGISTSGISTNKIEENYGLNDYWVTYIDTEGELLQQKTIGGSAEDMFEDGCRTLEGNYIAAGYSLSGISGNKTEANIGMDDFWIIKIDTSGVILWQTIIGGSDADRLNTILATPDGGYISGGWSSSNISDTKAENSIGSSDYWVIKFAPDTSCTSLTYFADYDGDGYGNSTFHILSCDTPAGYVLNNFDCNDLDALINPSTTEICNSIDDNCNSAIDEDISYYTYYIDNDADGYGDMFSSITNCIDTIPAGYTTDSTDCDDENNIIHEPIAYYADADADLYGNASVTETVCSMIPPAGYVTNDLDCNDGDIFINPSSNEVCNNIDDNCNITIDEGLPVQVLYADADGDDFGNAESDSVTCLLEITGYVSDSTDCDDTNATIYPGADEALNGKDDNCDNIIDNIYEEIENSIFQSIEVFPNPNEGIFSIALPENLELHNIQIFNMLGYTMFFEKSNDNSKIEIKLYQPNPGVYILLLITNNGNAYHIINIL